MRGWIARRNSCASQFSREQAAPAPRRSGSLVVAPDISLFVTGEMGPGSIHDGQHSDFDFPDEEIPAPLADAETPVVEESAGRHGGFMPTALQHRVYRLIFESIEKVTR